MKKSLDGHGIVSGCGALTELSGGWARYAVRALQDMSVSMCQVPSSGTSNETHRDVGTRELAPWQGCAV